MPDLQIADVVFTGIISGLFAALSILTLREDIFRLLRSKGAE
jgi:hypothetical protein